MKLKVLKKIYQQKKKSKVLFLGLNLIFTALYILISSASLKFATINSSVSPIWPATGLAISIVIFFGRKYILSIFLGALYVNLMTPGPFMNALFIALGNSAEAYLGSVIFFKMDLYKNKLEHLSELVKVATTSLLAPLASATIGVSSLTIFGLIQGSNLSQVWITWWIADAIGAMLLIPLVLSLKNNELGKLIVKLRVEPKRQLFILIISLISLGVFYSVMIQATSIKSIFLLFPLLIIFTYSKNRFVTYLFSSLLCAIALLVTVSGKGPFNVSTINQNMINLEIFIVAICITTMTLAGCVHFKFIKQIRFILICGWLFCGTAFYIVNQNHDKADIQAFQFATADIENRIKDKMSDYITILGSGRSLYFASSKVDVNDWKAFVEGMNISQSFSGMNGLGVVNKVESKDLAAYLKYAKNEIDSNFLLKEVPQKLGYDTVKAKDHFIISYIEPYEKNRSARGLDLGSELNRRSAAEKSMLTGEVTLTDRIRLIQDQEKKIGFLLFLPVYKKNYPLKSERERKIAFSHWVYSPFIAEKFLNSMLDKAENDELVFEIFDSPQFLEQDLIYSHNREIINPNSKSIFSKIKLGDKEFFIKWSTSKHYIKSHDAISTWIGFIGSLLVLIITLFVINVQLLEEKAKKIATSLHNSFLDAQANVKDHEVKLIESRRMANLGEMASSIAHEINNPLAIISGNIQQIKRSLINSDPFEDKEKMINQTLKVENTVNRIDKIIKGLRLISRDGTNDQMNDVSVDALLEETLALCLEKYRTSNVILKVQNSYHGEMVCRGTQISQVLVNLLNNAYDAIIELDEKWIELEIKEVNNYLQIMVVDSGMGIPDDIHDKIMMPFFTTKGIGKGTGLGLSISKGIVESHGGSFTIDTRHSHTCFIVKLPLNRVERNEKNVS